MLRTASGLPRKGTWNLCASPYLITSPPLGHCIEPLSPALASPVLSHSSQGFFLKRKSDRPFTSLKSCLWLPTALRRSPQPGPCSPVRPRATGPVLTMSSSSPSTSSDGIRSFRQLGLYRLCSFAWTALSQNPPVANAYLSLESQFKCSL